MGFIDMNEVKPGAVPFTVAILGVGALKGTWRRENLACLQAY